MKSLFPYYHNVAKFFKMENLVYKNTESLHYIIDNIFLGDYRAADSLETLAKYNITHIINCAFNLPNKFPKQITYKNLDFVDDPSQEILPKLDESYHFIKQNSSNNILIHCVFGASRSGATVLYYLMRDKKWSYDKAFQYTKEKRNTLKLNPGFEKQLREYEKTISLI